MTPPTPPVPARELREKIDDLTARLHPTGEIDDEGNPVYQESRLPLSMLNDVVQLFESSMLSVIGNGCTHKDNPVCTIENSLINVQHSRLNEVLGKQSEGEGHD